MHKNFSFEADWELQLFSGLRHDSRSGFFFQCTVKDISLPALPWLHDAFLLWLPLSAMVVPAAA